MQRCSDCGKPYKNMQALLKHISSSTQCDTSHEQFSSCTICYQKFKSPRQASQHKCTVELPRDAAQSPPHIDVKTTSHSRPFTDSANTENQSDLALDDDYNEEHEDFGVSFIECDNNEEGVADPHSISETASIFGSEGELHDPKLSSQSEPSQKGPDVEHESENMDNITLWKVLPIEKGTSFNMPEVIPKHVGPMAQMIKILFDSGSPLYVLDSLMAVVNESMLSNHLTPGHIPTYDASLTEMKRLFSSPKARSVTIKVATGYAETHDNPSWVNLTFPVFDFFEQLQSLLDSSVFENINNLVVNPEDPFSRYKVNKNADNVEIMDAEVFQNASREVAENAFALALQTFVDKTGASDMYQRYTMEPKMFTLPLLKEHQRRNPNNWRCLGMIPKLDSFGFKDTLHKTRAYHLILDVFFKPIVDVGMSGKLPVMRLRLGEQYSFVPIHPLLISVIADNEGNETNCCKIQHRKGSNRLCRACHVSQANSDNVRMDTQCLFINETPMERLTVAALGPPSCDVDDDSNTKWGQLLDKFDDRKAAHKIYKDVLKSRKSIAKDILNDVFRQHVVDNAYWKLRLPSFPRGIYGTTGTDPMHANESGTTPYVSEVIIVPLSDGMKTQLDVLAKELLRGNRPKMREDYPRINISSGFSSLSRESADEKVGKMFLLSLLMETPRGRKVIETRCDPDFDAKREEIANRFKKKSNDEKNDKKTEEKKTDEKKTDENNRKRKKPPPTPDDVDGPSALDPENVDDRILIDGILTHALGLDFVVDYIGEMESSNKSLAYKTVLNVLGKKLSRDGDGKPRYDGLHKLDKDLTGYFDSRPVDNHVDKTLYTTYEHDVEYKQTKKDVPKKAEHSVDGSVDEVRSICQQLLAFQAMYSYGCSNPKSENNSHGNFGRRVKQMLQAIFKVLKRGGEQWCISKFHEFLHFVTDRLLFGNLTNINGNKCESGLKVWQKGPSRTVSKSRGQSQFLEDITTRLGEHVLITLIDDLMYHRN